MIHLANRLALAVEEALGFVDEEPIVVEPDLAGARRRAAFDLIEQAGARAALIDAIGTGSEQERPLQHIDGTTDGARRREGTEVCALAVSCAAMLHHRRCRVVARDQDIRKRLIVAHQHVEARTEALDKVGFEQKRFGFGADGDEFHRCGRQDHARDAICVTGQPDVIRYSGFELAGLADVDDVTVRIEHAINARRLRQRFQITGNNIDTGLGCLGRGCR